MSTATQLLTVEEFRSLPDPEDGSRYELHSGELVRMAPPKHRHIFLQVQLRKLLEGVARENFVVHTELAFRATPEHEFRFSDVGVVSWQRFASIDPDDNLMGAPDMVIEVESPSNTSAELDAKERLCLANGCREFWIVYPTLRYVRVATENTTKRYKEGEEIPLQLFPGQSVSVSEIFSIVPNPSQG